MITEEMITRGLPLGLFDDPAVATLRVVDLPAGCTGWKLRHRFDEFSRLFLRFPDGIEERHIIPGHEPGTCRPYPVINRSTRRGVPAPATIPCA